MFRRLALTGRVLVTVVGITAAFLFVCAWLAVSYRNTAYEDKRVAIRQITEVGAAVAEHYAELEKRGVLTGDEARRQAIEALKSLRYDKDQYFWINDMYPRMVMHPTNAKLNGADLNDYKDPTGKKLFVEMVAVAKAKGAGLVEYQWPKPGSRDPEPKFSYVKHVPAWGWIVGSGIYVDDVEREIRAKTWGIGLLTLLAAMSAAFGVAVLIRSTVRPLKDAVAVLGRGSDEVTEASRQVAAASQSLSQGATTQAASLEETSASMEEMASMTRQNSTSAAKAADLMAQTESLVTDANAALQQLVASMNGIQQSSAEVAKIIKTIDEIAFQTNILALNAAVEAARAGEAGMGFAVVADEVRSLAQRAAQAAKDTSALIEQAGTKAQDGGVKVTGVASVTAAITKTSLEVKCLVDQIAQASRQQTQGLDQVSQAVVQMEKLTQTTAATAEESAAASEELSAQAETTRDIAARLGALVGAHLPPTTRTAPPGRSKVVPLKPQAAAARAPTPRPASVPADLEDTGTFGRF